METNFNFKSSPCTSIEQSIKLLALGLKKETSDMHHWQSEGKIYTYVGQCSDINGIPAWSLGRLLELIKHSDICHYNDFGCIKLYIDLDDFETCITMISYMVKEGYFNKEYLER